MAECCNCHTPIKPDHWTGGSVAPKGGVPFGYVRDQHGIIVADKEAQRVFSEIQRRSAVGETCTEIAYALNRQGSRKRDGKPWNRGSIARLLQRTSKIRERIMKQTAALKASRLSGIRVKARESSHD